MEQVLRNLEDMKYSELQKIAKNIGIKANVKVDKLQKALREYYTDQIGGDKAGTATKHIDTIQKAKHDSMDTDEKTSEDEKETKKTAKRVTKKAKRRGGRRKATKKEEEEISEETVTSTDEKQNTPVILEAKVGSRKKTPVITKPVTPHRVSGQQNRSTPLTPQMIAVKNVMGLKQTKTPQSQKRKRSGSLPRPVPQSGSKPSTPVAEPSNKRLRRSTFEKTEDLTLSSPKPQKEASPGVKAMISVMKSDMDSAERKATLLKALDDKVQKAKGRGTPTRGEKNGNSTTTTQIPRFAAFLAKKKEEAQKKPITPGNKDWTQVHQKEFDKFDSIDVYLAKKRQRTKSITKSVTKVTQIIEESKKAISNLKNHNTPNNENKPHLKPKHDTKSNLFKSPSGPTPFQPSVFKTKNINTNFGVKTSGTVVNSKTPANQGPIKKATPKTGNMKTTGNTVEKKTDRKSIGAVSARKSTGVTPFKFTATLNTTMPDMKSAKKPVFDLKASLSRPITWKSHKGKLKPVGDNSYAGPAPDSSVKTPKIVSREDRRTAMANHRANKKHQSQMQRRGIHA